MCAVTEHQINRCDSIQEFKAVRSRIARAVDELARSRLRAVGRSIQRSLSIYFDLLSIYYRLECLANMRRAIDREYAPHRRLQRLALARRNFPLRGNPRSDDLRTSDRRILHMDLYTYLNKSVLIRVARIQQTLRGERNESRRS